ncbi:AI-2E family transporter [Granulicella cerasi]|uniref:AI-2E family transporter n=1 Tax=Granulicella cerasi TaxID=741063 RepID=A0ABW1ZEG9_9BACT|nr:AI-2E family transporter [Granulicella cerasi]
MDGELHTQKRRAAPRSKVTRPATNFAGNTCVSQRFSHRNASYSQILRRIPLSDAHQTGARSNDELHPEQKKQLRALADGEALDESPDDEDAPDAQQTRTIRGHIVFFFAVLLFILLAWRLRHALGIIYVSALFAVVLMPMVEPITKLRFGKFSPNRTVGVAVLFVGIFAALTAFVLVGLPPVLHDMQGFASEAPARIPELVQRMHKLPFANRIGIDHIAAQAEGAAGNFAHYILSSVPEWLSALMDLVEALILCIYFMLEGEFAYFYFLSLVPKRSRGRLAKTLLTAEQRMSKWLLGQGALMLILGVSSTIVFAALHVRYFFLLGMLMGLFNIIPVVGGIITIVLAAGVAALDSWAKMGGVLLFYFIYIQIENAYLTPKIMRTSVDLMGLGVLVALLCGTTLAGVVGAMVAVPTAALVVVLIDEYLVQKDAGADLAQKIAQSSRS